MRTVRPDIGYRPMGSSGRSHPFLASLSGRIAFGLRSSRGLPGDAMPFPTQNQTALKCTNTKTALMGTT